MKSEVLASADLVAQRAATIIASDARAAIAKRGRFLIAVSGGKTPWMMLRALSHEDLPWESVHVFQVDERIAPENHPDRNLIHIRESLPIGSEHIHPMPVNAIPLEQGAAEYARLLRTLAGDPPILDFAHLGMGADGHTASLIPGDPVLDITDRDVALTGEYQGRKRMTLTYPILNRSRRILWVITGTEKAAMLKRLQSGDASIPAGRIDSASAIILSDRAASP